MGDSSTNSKVANDDQPLKTVLFLGSIRDGRYGSRVGHFVKKLLEKEYGHQVDLIDPLETEFPMLKTPLHFYPDQSQAPRWLVDINERIKAADAFVLVSAEYNYSIPPALSNMLDHFPMQSFAFKPTALAVYSLEWFSIPSIYEALDAEGNPTRDGLVEKAKLMAGQLDWYARATRAQRAASDCPTLPTYG